MAKKKGSEAHPGAVFRREHYALEISGDEVVLTMYGDIVQEVPRDWLTGEPMEGQYISLEEFMRDLDMLAGAKSVTLRINSCGGDVFAAIPIHNRLRELGAKITAVVDGAAMSGGALIMCAADTVRANPSSLVMVHKCWRFMFGGFNSDELRRIAASNDAVDRAQAEVYARKTGRDEAEIIAMMAEETYMTGREAVEMGFADELTQGEPATIEASADMRTLYVNGRALKMPYPLTRLPGHVAARAVDKERGAGMPTTLEELKKSDPALAAALLAQAQAQVHAQTQTRSEAGSADASAGQVHAQTHTQSEAGSVDASAGQVKAQGEATDAAQRERERIRGIDEVAALLDQQAVIEAKYGPNACTAQEMLLRAAQAAAKAGEKFLIDWATDSEESGVSAVKPTPSGDGYPNIKEKGLIEYMDEARALIKSMLGKEDGGAKNG